MSAAETDLQIEGAGHLAEEVQEKLIVPETADNGVSLSKNRLKKLKRKQEWEAGRESRKEKRKVKVRERKLKKRQDREKNIATQGTSKDDGENPSVSPIPPPKTPRLRPSQVQLPITFVIDCGFDDLMLDKERVSLGAQLTRCYSDNHKAQFIAHLVVSSFTGNLRHRFDTLLCGNHQSWKGVRFLDEDFVKAAEKAADWMATSNSSTELPGALGKISGPDATLSSIKAAGEIVYLTSDSSDTLTELKPYSTYIIGGLVDKNRHKGICYKRAMDAGIKTARLPIGDYMEMTSRFVLATNHVYEIMLRWLELGDWGEAFVRVMPKRKGGKLRKVEDEGRGGGEQEDVTVDAEGTVSGGLDASSVATATERIGDAMTGDVVDAITSIESDSTPTES